MWQRSRGIDTARLVYPSPLSIYSLARRRKYGKSVPLIDTGCEPYHAWRAIQEVGWTSIAEFPFDPATVNDDPPLGAVVHTHVDVPASAILTNRQKSVKNSVFGKAPVLCGLCVDQGFEEYVSGVWQYSGPLRGRHYVVLVGYDADGAWALNSWGVGFGRLGFIHVGWATLENPVMCGDLVAIG